MTIKAIIFDYGEVLNAPDDLEAEMERRRDLAGRINLPPEELWPFLFDCDESRQWMTGQISWDQFWTTVLAKRGITDPEEVSAFSRDIFDGREQLNPDMADLLLKLDSQYKLAVLSNTSWSERALREKLEDQFGLPAGLFDLIVTSGSVGYVKPEAEIYQIALKRLGVEGNEAIFTDDLPDFTAAARRQGMYGHTFTSPDRLQRYLAEMGVI